MKEVKGGITAANGFVAAGVNCGIKEEMLDLALVYSQVPAISAATFTQNTFKAPPVIYCENAIKNRTTRAIIVNSGMANACTGARGLEDSHKMSQLVADTLGIEPEEVLVSSTGVIGEYLPMDKISLGIKKVVPIASENGGNQAARAIMTTDTAPKEFACQVEIGGKQVRIGGMAKGSGMIHPNMATMLAYLTTDVCISKEMLNKALKHTVDRSYNLITVDGDTSTNDTVAILANGLAGNKEINVENNEYQSFLTALQLVNTQLAKKIVEDGEGATKFLEVKVQGVASFASGKRIARSVLTSNLVKTAFFGEDANWGRIIMAMGNSGEDFNPEKVDIFLGDEQVAANGRGLNFSEEKAKEILCKKDITITINLNLGSNEAVAWGTDLSYEYVKINGSYRT